MKITQFTLIGILALGSVSAHAEKVEFECPEEIKTKQTQAAPIKGWAAHVDTVNARQIFTGLEMFNGHPKDGAPLFADETPATPTTVPAVSPGGTAPTTGSATETVYKIPAGHEAYVSCQYTNTLVRLIKKLPKGVQTCRVRFSEALGHVQKAVCE